VLQFIRSGRVAVTRSNIERLSDMLANIEKIRQEGEE
jgi:acetolactate synthase-1/3 small subunit